MISIEHIQLPPSMFSLLLQSLKEIKYLNFFPINIIEQEPCIKFFRKQYVCVLGAQPFPKEIDVYGKGQVQERTHI